MKINLIMLLALVLAVFVLLRFGRVTVKPLPKCNPYWPQSYSGIPLELQPCPLPVPTPMLE